jgi:hypothetical protein
MGSSVAGLRWPLWPQPMALWSSVPEQLACLYCSACARQVGELSFNLHS